MRLTYLPACRPDTVVSRRPRVTVAYLVDREIIAGPLQELSGGMIWPVENSEDLSFDPVFRQLDRCANAIQRAVGQSPFPVRRDDHRDLRSLEESFIDLIPHTGSDAVLPPSRWAEAAGRHGRKERQEEDRVPR